MRKQATTGQTMMIAIYFDTAAHPHAWSKLPFLSTRTSNLDATDSQHDAAAPDDDEDARRPAGSTPYRG